MSEQQSSYRQIMKATSIFGGVQVVNIIISIVRSKFVAILLGPTGMGIMGLLNSTTVFIGSITNFGLGTSAVKDIAEAFGTENEKRVDNIITVIRRLVWLTGILGLTTTAILSPWLSELTFGNREYTTAFIWLSVTLLINQLSTGQLVILQGLRKLKYLAKANLAGSFTGLFVTLPLYYIWGLDGIVPGIIGTSLISLLMSWYYSGKVQIERTKLSRSLTIHHGKNMLKMGFLISLSGLLTLGGSYITRIYIGRIGSVEQVGFYNAGFAIITTYVGLVFNAMATDFYPRLSAVAFDNNLCKKSINQQAEMAILILAPILIIFLVFINWVVIILYSRQFTPVNEMIHWAALGMFFKAASWTIGFIFLAKGNNKLFFLIELISNSTLLILTLLGYYYGQLTGIGISFTVYYIFYLVLVFSISKAKYEFSFDKSFIQIFMFQFGLAVLGFLTIKYIKQPYTYLVGLTIIGLSSWHSILQLNKRLKVISQITNYISRKSKN